MNLNMPSYSRLMVVFIQHPEALLVVAKAAPHLLDKTVNDKWVNGIRPIGDEFAPLVDDLMSEASTASSTAEAWEDMVIAKMDELNYTLDDGQGNKRKVDRPFLRKIGKLFLDDVLPALL